MAEMVLRSLNLSGANKFPSKAGIYYILNIRNNKMYVGSSVNFLRRLKSHRRLLTRNVHHAYKLQGAWNKHGSDSFAFGYIELVYFPEDSNTNYKTEMLECIEQTYIDKFDAASKNNYNTSRIAGGLQSDRHSFSEATKKSWRTRREKGNHIITPEHKRAISIGLSNSALLKEHLVKNGIKKRKKIYQYNTDGILVREWEYMNEVCKEGTGFRNNGIQKCLYGVAVTYKGYVFSYKKCDTLLPREKRKRKSKQSIS